MPELPVHIPAGSALAIWRLPYTADVFLVYNATASQETWDGKSAGFVMAPFTTHMPQLFIRGEASSIHLHTMNELQFPTEHCQLPPQATQLVYENYVAESITRIQSGKLHKTVAARYTFHSIKDFSAVETFAQLCDKYPAAFVSLVYHPTCGLWMGATPEQLLLAQHTKLYTMSLAGTRNSSSNWTEKERDEQRWVTSFIEGCLHESGLTPETSNLTELNAGNGLEHLVNYIEAALPEGFNALKLLSKLHPTPAVGGLPQAEAVQWVNVHEPHRQYYSGYLGPVQNNRNFSLFVNLRCMRIYTQTAVLYAGAGITALSQPADEWLETDRKLQIIKSVL